METIKKMEIEANKLYNKLEIGSFFDLYHDTFYYLISEFDYLEENCEIDYKIATEILNKCKAIIKAQKTLLKANI